MKKIFILLLMFFLCSCSSPEKEFERILCENMKEYFGVSQGTPFGVVELEIRETQKLNTMTYYRFNYKVMIRQVDGSFIRKGGSADAYKNNEGEYKIQQLYKDW
jgi:hypothetical protein